MVHSVALHEQTYLETFPKEDTKDVVKRKLLEDLTLYKLLEIYKSFINFLSL